MANVTLKNVTKKFGDVVAVKNVELDIEDREFVVLVGPSGCGKSTTLRMIAGLEEITEGGIYIGDQFINHLAPKDRNIAMVFQSYALYPHMKVSDNMAFGLKMRKISKADRETKVEEIADILGIRDLLDRKPKELSGGQRQRVALGRAIVRDPEVFLFDEPLSNLDAKLRVQMRTELKKLHETLQTTAVYVTHDQVEAMTMGTRIVVMKDGLVQQVGSPLTLYNRPANRFVAGFIGSPAMNFLPCRVAEEGSRLFVDTGDFRVPLEESTINKPGSENGGEFLFGIRPEDFRARTHHEDPSPGNAVIRARVDVIEPLGKEIMLNINTGRHSLNVILPSDTEVKMHQELELGLAMEKSHLFQKESGKAVI